MTALETAMWFGLTAVGCIAVVRWPRQVPEFGVLTVYRRGGVIAMPAPGRCRTEPREDVPSFDAVIVSSARGADALLRAALTARNADAPLVVLASGRTDASAAARLLRNEVRLVLSTPAELPEPDFLTFRHPCASTVSDVSRKRNAGLVLARLRGWRTVLFLDDDVQAIASPDLQRAAGLLAGTDRGGAPRRLVGWAFRDFRDLSTVGHACWRDPGEPVSFVGGGAMAVNCDDPPPPFPPVYNEDLLVGLALLLDDPASVCVTGTLTQDEYRPFDDPARAVSQEFGEVLAEGWSRRPAPEELRRAEFWASVLRDRRALVSSATSDLERRGVSDGVRAMRAVLATHQAGWPQLLAGFVQDWTRDTAVWRDFLVALRP
ncbi:hypothetical protein [Amycolatopsis sp. NPDC051102]|uniref:hypothetical protein n=1 Tax=Amycolatopsis sp. NPDC051102 TaxID=3155163 RepID=UPI0034245873